MPGPSCSFLFLATYGPADVIIQEVLLFLFPRPRDVVPLYIAPPSLFCDIPLLLLFYFHSVPFIFSCTSGAEPVSSIHSVYTIIYNMADALSSPS